MKKLNQLLIVETGEKLPPLLPAFAPLLSQFSEEPVAVLSLNAMMKTGLDSAPALLFLHTDLLTIEHLQQFVQVHTTYPYSSIIIVGNEHDDELCLLAIEAGADDVITVSDFSSAYLRKMVLISQRRQRTESEILKSHDRLLACLQGTPNVAVQWYNSKSRVLFWNHASERIFGWPAKEAIGRTIDELIHIPENKEFWRNKIQRLAQTGESYGPQEWNFRYRDGSEGCCISSLLPIPSDNGEPWFVCIDVEITDRKRAEQALQQSETKYRSLIDQQADAITIFNKEGQILDVNNSAVTLLGYRKEELQSLRQQDVLRQEESVNKADFFNLQIGKSNIRQYKMQRQDGTLLTVEVHTKRLSDELFLASVRDLTERLDAQQQLQKEIALSDTIINSLPGLFYLFQKDGTFLRWNKQLETISGYTAEEIATMSPLDFFTGNHAYTIAQAIATVFANGSAHAEANLVTKSGQYIPYYFTGIAIDFANAECLLGTGIDRSALKSLEDKLAQEKIESQKKIMQAMIEAEEKEKAKLGLELHDNVNQILSVVRMYLSILKSDKPIEGITLDKAMDLLNKAMQEIRLLSHGLAVTYTFEADLTSTLKDAVDKIGASGEFTMNLSVPPQLDEYLGNQQKLAVYRIVQEQLANIVKYAKPTMVDITIVVTEDELQIIIKDNGIGFDSAKTQKGLGLNNIINRAEALGGKATVYSQPGKGTKLEAVIPLRDEE